MGLRFPAPDSLGIFTGMQIPHYPEFVPVDLDLQADLDPIFRALPSGISEFSFAGIFLFRNTYKYHVARLEKEKIVLRGEKDGSTFYALPTGFPQDRGVAKRLLEDADYLKGLSEPQVEDMRAWLEPHGYEICEDRDNFDYLYSRQELASLAGKRFHKKRNQVNSFMNTYANYELLELEASNKDDARSIVETWMEGREKSGDYYASIESIELQERLGLSGAVLYVEGKPAAFTMGEGIALGTTYVIHIEKADNTYKGIYQYLNQAYANSLPESYELINREQDLGDQGLRQAKLTYRPIGFVKKFRVCREELLKLPFHTRACDVQAQEDTQSVEAGL